MAAAAARAECPAHSEVSRRLEALEERMTTVERDRLEDHRQSGKQLSSIHEKVNAIGLQVATINGKLQGKDQHLASVVAILSLLVAAGSLIAAAVRG